ncbi:polysaccharide biosynthesis/export family protein [Leeuwenhoekiella marinoflava]|uniref:Polysaccharide export outer membrane protein n=2 Tax=Leeuwenhoekiella marinoflava TaxID=988 RepID=A0A4Q0PGE5_9FLAO|nr:polysaccharide biosynthesis/export family protein [Leeuwenhoekiella marinoflava]RXG26004.1 polysaccharide export outer membrane protein [Leeuwenhoekiella marinoflava]SHF75620.1 polysaccharide export outer membrane protein [Leeuwenhoekiella marinoflava DSM 3653]
MKHSQVLKLCVIAILSFCSSCVSRKDTTYFYEPDELNIPAQISMEQPAKSFITIQPNDELTITVSAIEQEAAIPFNPPIVGSGSATGGDVRVGGTSQLQTYLVDSQGNIEFPVLGTIYVRGLTRVALAEKLKNMITDYVENPIVNVKLSNFQVSVLGAVRSPGTYTISNEYLTIPKALGLAGDMQIYGRRDNVLVMREENDKVTKAYLDLTDNSVIDSKYYYLKQNDVLYVELNDSQRQAGSLNPNSGLFISAASLMISLIVLFVR